MVWFDILCQRRATTQFETRGTLRLHRGGLNVRKPLWLVLIMGALSLATAACITFVVADLSGLAPHVGALVGFGVMFVYALVAHWLRPEPNVDNLGWFGPLNNPFQFNDDINRWLWGLTIFFGPGRLIAMGFVDVCTYVGFIAERTEEAVVEEYVVKQNARELELVERADKRFAGKPQGVQQLASMKYLNPDSE